jgi:hypothetical protein
VSHAFGAAVELAIDAALQRRLLRAIGDRRAKDRFLKPVLSIVRVLRDGERRVVDIVQATGLSQPKSASTWRVGSTAGWSPARSAEARSSTARSTASTSWRMRCCRRVGDALAACSDGYGT